MRILVPIFTFCVVAAAWPELPPPVAVPEALKAHLSHAVARELPHGIELRVESISLGSTAPANAALTLLSPHPPLGLVNFELDWTADGRAHRAYGTAVVRAEARVAVARGPIRIGESLGDANVAFEKRELGPYLISGYFRMPQEIVGRRAAASLSPGALLAPGNTQLPAAVVAGQFVDLVNQRTNLRITARVKALEGGRVNDWIRVENPGSHRVLQARVAAAGEVWLR